MEHRIIKVGSTEDIIYAAKYHTSGLSDITCTIYKADGTVELASTSMTEIGSLGLYILSHSFDTKGSYIVRCNSVSQPYRYQVIYDTSGVAGVTLGAGGYCSVADVRTLTDLTTSDKSDADVSTIIAYAVTDINNAICKKVYNEEIGYIDQYRKNRADGSNFTYYIKDSFDWYFGDMDDSGALTVDDIEVWLYNSSNHTRTKQTVSSIEEYGKFVLDTAPPDSTDKLTINFRRCPVKLTDNELKKACAFLTASYAYSGIDAREKKRVSIRSFSISRDPKAEKGYYEKYEKCLVKLMSREPYGKSRQEEWLHPVGQYPQRVPIFKDVI